MAEEDCWVFDSLVCFLNGPVWNAPMQSFIEERSLIFEPNGGDDVEYRAVFVDFKNLVEFMLSTFMEDIGITQQQFEIACLRGARDGGSMHFDQNIFEQIWAASDYSMFKRIMIQRNVELQLQALELIQQKFGKTPDLFIPQKSSGVHDLGESSLDETTAEINQTIKSSELEREVLVEVSKQFPREQEVEEPNDPEEEKFLEEEKHNLEETLKKTIEEKMTTQKQILEKNTEDSDDEKEESNNLVEPEEPLHKMERIAIDRPQIKMVDNIEMRKRQEYLRSQRDKLVALKKEARKKQLDVERNIPEKSPGISSKAARPKSAKAAKDLLTNTRSVEPQSMKLRKALIERLKSEVIQKND